jgi:hypothetical protein
LRTFRAPRSDAKVESFDRRGDGLGSIIRVRLAISFLELAPPS